jgi:hypothetical protein
LAPTVLPEIPTKFGKRWRASISGGVLMTITRCSVVSVSDEEAASGCPAEEADDAEKTINKVRTRRTCFIIVPRSRIKTPEYSISKPS